MKHLEFNFHDGKQRVIDLLENHINDFEHDMMHDVKITIDRDEADTLGLIEDIIETARMNRNAVEKAITKVQDSSSIQEILSAVKGTCYEEMEETVLNELFGLKSITVKFY